MKFALIIYQPHPFDPKALSPEQHKAVADDYAAVSSAPGVTPAPALGFASGPYAGETHAVGGFMMLEADSLEDAVALAARIPAARLGGAIEVRPCEVYW
jgi:hypothetical protein